MSTTLVKLVQFTDSHLFADPAGRLRGVPTLAALQATIAAAEADLRGADAVLATGDLVQDDPEAYLNVREAFGGLGKPVLCIPGNHDDAPTLRRVLADPPFQVCGHSDLNAWRVVLLDSSVPQRAAGALAPSQLASLEASLASAADRHVLIALHHHPVPMDSDWLDTVGLENAEDFFALIDRYPAVRAIVFGHVHQAFETTRRGVRILGTPSTCAQFLPHSRDFAVDALPPAYRVLQLEATGAVSTRIVWLSAAARERVLTEIPGSRTAALVQARMARARRP